MAYTTIDDPSAYFHTQLYAGNASTNVITNDGNSDLQPDWVWIKNRTTAGKDHVLYDSSRGVNKQFYTNNTNDEDSVSNGLTSFNTDGFTLGDNGGPNASGDHVAWQWKANGGTTVSNTDGSITSTVQANTTAGFSIVTFTSNGSNGQTVGHGLGVAPKMIITKNRSATGSWYTYNYDIGANHWIRLNGTDAKNLNTNVWGNTHPTSSVFTIGLTDLGYSNTNNVIAYCFAEKQGYSSIKSYTGNGSENGPFIYTGFKPAWIMFKKTSGTDGWGIFDNRRGYQNATNPLDAYLQPNNSNAESGESDSIDFLSNGFKWRISSGFRNESGSNFIYMCFASSPFVGSDGTPTTAR